MTNHDDPNYPWIILSEKVADKFFELLDPIVDHKKDTLHAVNRMADWIDDERTKQFSDGWKAAVEYMKKEAASKS